MIIAKIIGGLGNQLFQYATGLAVAQHTKTILRLDLTNFATYEHHTYSLKHFTITAPEATTLERLLYKQFHYYKEKSFRYDDSVWNRGSRVYLDGYWQSERYFIDIRPILKKEFSLKEPLSKGGTEIAAAIRKEVTPVCMHVRHGDFANNPSIAKYHGTTPLEYHYEAAKIVRARVPNAHFFVFSDSPEWVQENLRLPYPVTFIGQGADKNYEDIALMSLCRHFILSNSSFGWWGAWLSDAVDKIVIAPKKWTNTKLDITDLIPQSWIRI